MRRDEIDRFHRDGFVGPFELCTPREAAGIKARIVDEVLSTPGFCFERNGARVCLGPLRFRHLDQPVVYELTSHPAIVERMACLFGPDLVVWKTQFFHKTPGGRALPWHQDYKYWPLNPVANISAWIALDDVSQANGCVRALPGSHTRNFTHVPMTADPRYVDNFPETVAEEEIEGWPQVSWEAEAGQFFLFSNPVHASAPNDSTRDRLGLVTRVTIPIVKVDQESLFPQHRNLVLSGRDVMGFNRLGTPPQD